MFEVSLKDYSFCLLRLRHFSQGMVMGVCLRIRCIIQGRGRRLKTEIALSKMILTIISCFRTIIDRDLESDLDLDLVLSGDVHLRQGGGRRVLRGFPPLLFTQRPLRPAQHAPPSHRIHRRSSTRRLQCSYQLVLFCK